jgi:hypothetical protein
MRNSNSRKSRKALASFSVAALAAISVSLTTSALAVQPTVNLGSTASYAVLAGSGITNTGPTLAGISRN